MRYKSFRIQNFKGIKDTTITLQGVAGASVFAFVGLNESGKTTVLEAIHSFSPDDATSELLSGGKGTGTPLKNRVPRHRISDFTGDISITATVAVTEQDKKDIADGLLEEGIILDQDSFPNEVVLRRFQRFEDGDFKKQDVELLSAVKIKSKKQRTWRDPREEEIDHVSTWVYTQAPDVAYFPTFVFDFPEQIFLTDRGNKVDRFYRRVFQDILDYDGRGNTIEKDIIRRVRQSAMVLPWLQFLTAWSKADDQEKIQHVMARAGAAVTKLVFGKWDKIFH